MTNIDLFNSYTADVLSRLYAAFPVKVSLDVRVLSGHQEIDDYGAVITPDGHRSKEAEIAFATIEWLIESGYIRAGGKRPPLGFTDCVLTSSGLDILNAVPDGVRSGETWGGRLARLVREGSVDLAKEAVTALIRSGLDG